MIDTLTKSLDERPEVEAEREADTPPRAEGLPQRIAEAIREKILTGALAPGQRVPERVLTEAFKVSRTPLREALRMLTADGLLILEPNRGAVVAAHSEAVIRGSIEFVELIESAAGALACERATDREIRDVAALTCEMKAAFLRGDRIGYYRLNSQVHRAIVAAAHNTVIQRQHEIVNARLYRIRFMPNARQERWQAAMAEHEAIVEALMARDAPRLSKILREHLSHAWRRFGYDPQGGG